jgi:hypothetical protein
LKADSGSIAHISQFIGASRGLGHQLLHLKQSVQIKLCRNKLYTLLPDSNL